MQPFWIQLHSESFSCSGPSLDRNVHAGMSFILFLSFSCYFALMDGALSLFHGIFPRREVYR